MGIMDYIVRKYQIFKIKSSVNKDIPNSIEKLRKKYNFSEDERIRVNSSFGRVYILDENRVGKVLRLENFGKLREEYISQRISNELGLPVLQAYELVLAKCKNKGKRYPMLVIGYGGKKRLCDINQTKEITEKYKNVEEKVRKYLF